ncbi:MAG TPA: hypothetical protein VGO03_15950 [Acidimicrobiia bacterium]
MSVEPSEVSEPEPSHTIDGGAAETDSATPVAPQPPVLRAIVTPLTEQLANAGIDKHTLLNAEREHQLALVASAMFAISAFFEWWNGLVRVHGIVNFSATGSGSAFSDWRGWIALALMATCAAVTVLQIVNGNDRRSTQIAAGAATAALCCTLWFWAAYSASVALSDATGTEFGAGFGLYLGLAATITAVVATMRRLILADAWR